MKYYPMFLNTRKLYFTKKTRVSCLGLSYNVVGHEFSVKESTIYSKQDTFKQKCTKNKVIY